MQLGSRPVDTTSLLSILRGSRPIHKDTEMMPHEERRLFFTSIRNQRGGGVVLGTGADEVACRGRALPTKFRSLDFDDGEEGGIPRCPVLSGTQLHSLHPCCSE